MRTKGEKNMQKRLLSLILCVLALGLLFTLTTSNAQGKSALEVAKEFYKAAMEGDFKKLATLGCKNAGPYTTYQDARKIDLAVFGFIEQVVREEDSDINLENLKLVVARVKAWGVVSFGAFYIFKSPKGYKVYISPKGEFLYEYPSGKIDLMETAVDFYISNNVNLDKTIELVQTILESKPSDLETNYRLGYLYSQKGWRQGALSQYRKLITLDRDYAEKRMDSKDLIETWISLLKHPISRELRFYAANELYRKGKTELAKEAWFEMLKDEDKKVRFYAATRLYGTGDRRGVSVLVEWWKQIFREDKSQREGAAQMLVELEAIDTLADFLKDEDKELRYDAAEELYKRGDKRAVPVLIEKWNEVFKTHKREQEKAVKKMAEIGGKEIVPFLTNVLEDQIHYRNIAPTIAELLGKLGDYRAVPVLIKALDYEEKTARSSLEALGNMEAKEAVPHLKKTLGKYLMKGRREIIGKTLEVLTTLTGEDWIDFMKGEDYGFLSSTLSDMRNIYIDWRANTARGGLIPRLDPDSPNFKKVRRWIFERWGTRVPTYTPKSCHVESIKEIKFTAEVKAETEFADVIFTLQKTNGLWQITDVQEEEMKEPRIATVRLYTYDHTAKGAGKPSGGFGIAFPGDEWMPSLDWRDHSIVLTDDQLFIRIEGLKVGYIHASTFGHIREIGFTVKLENATFEDGSQEKTLVLFKYEVLPGMEVPKKIEKYYKIIPKYKTPEPIEGEEPKSISGVKGEYFNLSQFGGKPAKFPEKPVLSRVDRTIDFNWGDRSPDPAISPDYFGVRWTGFIYIPTAGTYKFRVWRDDGCRLIVDHMIIFGAWYEGDWNRWIDFEHYFEKTGWHPFKLEFYEIAGGARITLKWQIPGESFFTVIPASHLRTGIEEKKPQAEKQQKVSKAEHKIQERAKKEETKIPHVNRARVSNADDKAAMYVNGKEVVSVTGGTGRGGTYIGHRPGDSGWVDITSYLKIGDNILRFWVWNKAVYGAVSATFEVQVNGVPAISRNFQKQDSTAGVKYDETVILSLPNPR